MTAGPMRGAFAGCERVYALTGSNAGATSNGGPIVAPAGGNMSNAMVGRRNSGDDGGSRQARAGSSSPFDRRLFLDSILSIGFVSTAAAIAYPISRYLVPPATGEPATASVVAGAASALKANSGVLIKFGSRPAIVVKTIDGRHTRP